MKTIKFECDVPDELIEDAAAPVLAALRTVGEGVAGAGWPVRLTVDDEAVSP